MIEGAGCRRHFRVVRGHGLDVHGRQAETNAETVVTPRKRNDHAGRFK